MLILCDDSLQNYATELLIEFLIESKINFLNYHVLHSKNERFFKS